MCLTEETQLIPSKCRMRKIHRLGYGTCVYKSWIHGRDPQTADKSTRLRLRIAGHFQNLVADSSLGNRLPSPERVNALHLSPRPLNAIFKNVRERRPVPEPVWTPFLWFMHSPNSHCVPFANSPSSPLRAAYGSYGDGKEPRPRSRSPAYPRESRESRDGRDSRESRDGRDSAREPRPRGHSRDHDYRYRSSEARDKDPRDAAYR